MLKPEAESDPPDQLFLLSPAVIGKEHLQVQACSFSVLQWIKQILSKPLVLPRLKKKKKFTLAIVCHLQLDREPVATPAVTSVAETPKPDLPSLSILG